MLTIDGNNNITFCARHNENHILHADSDWCRNDRDKDGNI